MMIFIALVFSVIACVVVAALLQDVKVLARKCDDGYVMCCRLNSRIHRLEGKLLERRENTQQATDNNRPADDHRVLSDSECKS